MQSPDKVQPLELTKTLELMGLTQHSRIGNSRVFIIPDGDVLRINEEWDMPGEDVERILERHGLSVSLFWEKHQSLFE